MHKGSSWKSSAPRPTTSASAKTKRSLVAHLAWLITTWTVEWHQVVWLLASPPWVQVRWCSSKIRQFRAWSTGTRTCKTICSWIRWVLKTHCTTSWRCSSAAAIMTSRRRVWTWARCRRQVMGSWWCAWTSPLSIASTRYSCPKNWSDL